MYSKTVFKPLHVFLYIVLKGSTDKILQTDSLKKLQLQLPRVRYKFYLLKVPRVAAIYEGGPSYCGDSCVKYGKSTLCNCIIVYRHQKKVSSLFST